MVPIDQFRAWAGFDLAGQLFELVPGPESVLRLDARAAVFRRAGEHFYAMTAGQEEGSSTLRVGKICTRQELESRPAFGKNPGLRKKSGLDFSEYVRSFVPGPDATEELSLAAYALCRD